MEELNNDVSGFKEKAKKIITTSKEFFVYFFAKSIPFVKSLTAYKKQIVIAALVVVVVAIGASTAYSFRNTIVSWLKEENATFSSIRKAELVTTAKLGSKVIMGDLEITLLDVIEDSYNPLELDEEFKRVPPRGYFGARVLIFNTSYNQKEFLLFGLTDNLGNQLERDKEIDFYVDGVRDFGPATEIYPRTIRGGDIGSEKVYLLFPAPDPNVKKLQLTVMSETTNKKIVFDIER